MNFLRIICSWFYSELGAVLEKMEADTNCQSAKLVYSCENVTSYCISSSDIVTSSNGPDTVRIFEIEGKSE